LGRRRGEGGEGENSGKKKKKKTSKKLNVCKKHNNGVGESGLLGASPLNHKLGEREPNGRKREDKEGGGGGKRREGGEVRRTYFCRKDEIDVLKKEKNRSTGAWGKKHLIGKKKGKGRIRRSKKWARETRKNEQTTLAKKRGVLDMGLCPVGGGIAQSDPQSCEDQLLEG